MLLQFLYVAWWDPHNWCVNAICMFPHTALKCSSKQPHLMTMAY